jgi:hypothetical protein
MLLHRHSQHDFLITMHHCMLSLSMCELDFNYFLTANGQVSISYTFTVLANARLRQGNRLADGVFPRWCFIIGGGAYWIHEFGLSRIFQNKLCHSIEHKILSTTHSVIDLVH